MYGSDDQEGGGLVTRQEFLRGAAAVSLAAVAPATASAGATQKPSAAGDKPRIFAFTKFIQDMTPDAMATFLADAGFDGVELTLRAGGYILAKDVEEKLPRFVDALGRRNLKVASITTDIVAVDTPDAERVLRTAAKLGIGRYRLGFLYYDLSKPVLAQRDALRGQIRRLAELNRAYGIQGVYQNHSGENFVGAALWDYYDLIADIPASSMAFVYDTYHAAESGMMWPTTWNLVQSHLGAVSVKDFKWAGRIVEGVPLGQGQVDPKLLAMMGRSFHGDYFLHIEYLEKAGTAANQRALATDIVTLRRMLADTAPLA